MASVTFAILNYQEVGVVRGWGVGLVHWLIDQWIWVKSQKSGKVLMYSESDRVRVAKKLEQVQGNLRMGVVSVSISTCQWVYHLPKPARRLSAQLFSSCNKTQYFGSDRSPRRGNLILGLVVSKIFETRLSVCPWVQGLTFFISQQIVKGGGILGVVRREKFGNGNNACQKIYRFN